MRLAKMERTFRRARQLRRDMTEHERVLWSMLRDRRFTYWKFRRQAPLGDWVVDFVCYAARLIIELDGAQHRGAEQAAYDAARTSALKAAGFRVVRFPNSWLYTERQSVLDAIWHALNNPSPLVGEGGSPRSGETDEG